MKLSMTYIHWFGESYYMNIQFCAPPRVKNVGGVRKIFGLVGDFDGNKANDFTIGNEWSTNGITFGSAADAK
jgi:hypothetical protein